MFKLTVKQIIQQPKKAKVAIYLPRDFKNLCILLKNSAEGLGSKRKHCWGYVFVSENTPEKLTLKSMSPLNVNSATKQ